MERRMLNASKAIVPTDLYGQCADLKRINSICTQYGVPVVADSAEAAGARYQRSKDRAGSTEDGSQRAENSFQTDWTNQPLTCIHCPSSGDGWLHAGVGAKAAVFSFNGNKIITTSGGGLLASEDERLIAHARKLSQQARDPAPHYEHSEIGYNYRMSNIVAAIGRGQLTALDDRVQQKRRIFAKYQELLRDLPGIEFMPEAPYGRSNRWLTVILVKPTEFGNTADGIRMALEGENIESRPIWKPMHLQPVFAESKVRSVECGVETGKQAVARATPQTVSEKLFANGLCLPSGTALSDSDLERVAAVIRKCRGGAPSKHPV